MKLKEVVKIKPISTVIDFQSTDKTLIDAYIVLENTSEYFLKILEGISRKRDEQETARHSSIVPNRVSRCHKIYGTYGVGKSYFLLMLKAMLDSLNDKEMYEVIKRKFSDFPSIIYQLESLYNDGKKYIIVDINGKDFVQLDFKSIIERQIYKKLATELGTDKLEFDSFYERTAKQLKEWRSDNSVMYRAFIERLESDVDFTYEELIQGLEQRDMGAKKAYKKLYRTIMKQDPIDSFDSLREFLDESDRIVRNNGYDGIVVIFDEFSSYLNGRAEVGLLNIDLSSIDILAESTIPYNGLQLHFIVSVHEDMKKILERSIGNMETVNKTAGRFSNYELHFDRGSKLIENVIDRDQKRFDRIKLDNINFFNDYNDNVDLYRLEDIYPINPYTLEYLVRISEKYAQGDRTLFSFIDEKLRQFVEQEEVMKDGKLNLLGIDTVMDSFGSIITHGREEFSKAYNTQLSSASTELQKRIVKALALDYAITITDTGKIRAGINDSNIKYILSLTEEELKAAKEYLLRESNDAESYIVYNTKLDGYELSPDTAGVNIEEEIRKLLPKTNEKTQLRNLIAERANTLDIQANYTIKKEARKFPFDRYVEGRFVNSIGELKILDPQEELEDCSSSAKIIYYIPSAGTRYDYMNVLEIAKEKSKEFIDDRLAIAIPKEFTFAEDVSILKRYEAVKMLALDESIMSNPKSNNQIRLEIVDLRTKIYNKLSAFGRSENFIFIFKDSIKDDVRSIDHLLESWLIKKIYPRFPTVEVEDFKTRNASNPLIKGLIIQRVAEGVDIDTDQVFGKQIRWTLKPLDLVQWTKTVNKYRVEIKRPESHEITRKIFDIFAIPEGELSLKEKYKKLTSPPYGLNDPMFETLFGIFLQTTDEFYLKDERGGRVGITVDNLIEVWNKYELAKVKDAVPYVLKEDVIAILKLIDDNLDNSLRYTSLKASMPSDDFGQHENAATITSYMNILKQNVVNFIDNMDSLHINSIVIEHIDTIKQDIEKINNIIKPEDRLRFISSLIDKYFDNGIELRDEQDKIEHTRYVKFQNFMLNIKWLSNNAKTLRDFQDIIAELDSKTQGIDNESLVKKINELNIKMKDILNIQLVGPNWKDTIYEDTIDLDDMRSDILDIIKEYNDFYILNHNMLNVLKEELFDAVNQYEFMPLIEKLESINFKEILKLSQIKNQLHDIKFCNNILRQKTDKIIDCPDCGEVKKISSDRHDIQKKKDDIIENLVKIVEVYEDKLNSLYSLDDVKKEYGKHQTFDKYVEQHQPNLADKARQLAAIFRDDWRANYDKLMDLIEDLHPAINKFITSERPKEKPKRIISLDNVIKNISRNLALSGYGSMTITQFENVLEKELQKIKDNYDEIVVK